LFPDFPDPRNIMAYSVAGPYDHQRHEPVGVGQARNKKVHPSKKSRGNSSQEGKEIGSMLPYHVEENTKKNDGDHKFKECGSEKTHKRPCGCPNSFIALSGSKPPFAKKSAEKGAPDKSQGNGDN